MTAAGAERSEKGTFFLEGEVLPNQGLRKNFWDWRRAGYFVQPFLLSAWGFYTGKVKREAAPRVREGPEELLKPWPGFLLFFISFDQCDSFYGKRHLCFILGEEMG